MDLELCGKPTKAGTPCRSRVYGVTKDGCALHGDPLVAARLERAYAFGREAGASSAKWQEHIEMLNHEIVGLREELRQRDLRTHTTRGHQIVEVGERHLAYAWNGSVPLAIGDEVITPANEFYGQRVAVVTALGSTYRGELRLLQRRQIPLPA